MFVIKIAIGCYLVIICSFSWKRCIFKRKSAIRVISNVRPIQKRPTKIWWKNKRTTGSHTEVNISKFYDNCDCRVRVCRTQLPLMFAVVPNSHRTAQLTIWQCRTKTILIYTEEVSNILFCIQLKTIAVQNVGFSFRLCFAIGALP